MKRRGAGTLTRADIGTTVKLQAWVGRRRDHGGVLFLDLRDRSGIGQVVVRPEDQPEACRGARPGALASGWSRSRARWWSARPSRSTPRCPPARSRWWRRAPRCFRSADPLPFPIDCRADVTEETRLRYRYLDLRRPELQRNLMLRDRITHEVRRYFHEHGFLDVETPILTKSTPEGARDYLVPSRVHRGEFYALPQSPQLFKQLLMVAGFERYIQIARCFRDEDLRADRQPEFTQIDLEMSFPTEEDVYELIEGLFARIFPIVGIEVTTPFPRMTYAEAMARFGSDRPDLRFGLEIRDLTEATRETGFRAFAETAPRRAASCAASSCRVARPITRSQIDVWGESPKKHGLPGVLTLRRQNGELQFQVKNVLQPAELERLAAALELGEGDLALLAAGKAETVGARARHAAPRAGAAVPADPGRPLRIPLGDRVPALRVGRRGRAAGTRPHHPFTSPDPRDLVNLGERSRPGARARLRRGAQRHRARRRLDPYPRSGAPGARFPAAWASAPEEGRDPLRLPARRAALRRAAPRRHRAGPRPHRHADGRRDLAARRDRLPQDRLGDRPDDRRAVAGRRQAAARARHRGDQDANVTSPLRLRHASGETPILLGENALAGAGAPFNEWLRGRAVFVISTPTVLRFHGASLAPLAASAASLQILEVEEGEAAKSLERRRRPLA